ncbi:hypothetical protein ONE63_000597 [Megalurothrips usitatus]|uniref:CHK kinase-like domain-containing protein n=1 Tax=Megalurothrips usitatus TaxID=439358 RepID=A0AAV7Y500_9NEOP|nr:hypothetical protein ONE63_000597 [Megalurothrips usitatus]
MGTTGATPLLVLEDLTAKGYRLAASQCALDGAHVFLALQRLGKLHALSYSAKIRRRNDFISLAQTLANAEYSEAKRAFQSGVLARVGARGTQRLAARAGSGVDAATVEHLRRRLHSDRDSSPLYETMVAARSAEEPLAVIAHGDFCRNNIMFKYDEATGRPVDVVFFDLQTAKYCSAAVDLSFFLFLNTTRAQRAAHWDDFFLAYYDGLTTAMRRLLSNGSNPAVTPTMDMPSLSSLRADFARHALYGYTICSFFLPMMQPGNENQAPNHEDYAFVADMEDQYEGGCRVGEMMVAVGGEAGDDTAADLLAEFVERGLVGL